MKSSLQLSKNFVNLMVLVFIASAVGGCWDAEVVVTFESRYAEQVYVVFDDDVGLNYDGPYIFRYQNQPQYGYRVPAQESRTISRVGPRLADSKYGSQVQHRVTAFDLDLNIVYDRLFTWDELNDAGWHVVIDPALSD